MIHPERRFVPHRSHFVKSYGIFISEFYLGLAILWAILIFAGYLFTASLIGLDPNPHRAGFLLRAAVLVAAIAGHGILAKYLYAHPPDDIPLTEAQSGSMLMYYGGDIADAFLIGILCLQWYRAAGKGLSPRTERVQSRTLS